MAAEVETLRKRFEAAGQGHVFAEFDALPAQGAMEAIVRARADTLHSDKEALLREAKVRWGKLFFLGAVCSRKLRRCHLTS
jgi:hypothetical protein